MVHNGHDRKTFDGFQVCLTFSEQQRLNKLVVEDLFCRLARHKVFFSLFTHVCEVKMNGGV